MPGPQLQVPTTSPNRISDRLAGSSRKLSVRQTGRSFRSRMTIAHIARVKRVHPYDSPGSMSQLLGVTKSGVGQTRRPTEKLSVNVFETPVIATPSMMIAMTYQVIR